MLVVPNQKVVVCNTWEGGFIPAEYQPYYINSLAVLGKVVKHLSPSAVVVYLYFSRNRQGYKMALSCTDVCKWAGISKATYHRVIGELVEKRFLCPRKDTKNTYDFYLLPDNDLSIAFKDYTTEREEIFDVETDAREETDSTVPANSSRRIEIKLPDQGKFEISVKAIEGDDDS